MGQAVRSQSDQQHRRPAGEADGQTRQTKAMALVDTRSEAITQRKLADAIHNSPYMAVQRQHLRGMFGEAAQLKDGPENEELLQGKFDLVQRAGSEEEELL